MTNQQTTIRSLNVAAPQTLGLRAGELVEVRSHEEILATLDAGGTLDAMPFMPEMLEYCGQRLRVYKRADKTCDFVDEAGWSLRRLTNTVHLEQNRCGGEAHGGCQAACLIFWKEAWLKRVDDTEAIEAVATPAAASHDRAAVKPPRCTSAALMKATRRNGPGTEEVFVCQMTELKKFTSPLTWWDVRHVVRDIRSGNLDRGYGTTKSERLIERMLAIWEAAGQMMLGVFNKVQKLRHHVEYPPVAGELKSTPSAVLNLRAGDIVRVKSSEEILKTLDQDRKNRGLLFDAEMLRFCGGMFRVLRRVERIVHEKSGRLIKLPKDCIILEGAFCKADYHMSCPRSIYPYWREIWLSKVGRVDDLGTIEGQNLCAQPPGEARQVAVGSGAACEPVECGKRLPMANSRPTAVTH